ncbi:MAG: nucleotide exchange factor GrpE [Patescibacteria group bacterium]
MDTELEYTEDNENSDMPEDGSQASVLQKKLETLKNEIAVCKKEREEYLSGWQRCQADAVNAQNEEEKRQWEYAQFAAWDIFTELTRIAIIFDHAFKDGDEQNPYTRGFRNLYTQLMELLSKNGVEPIEASGKLFDASIHEAIESIPVDTRENDHRVMEEIEKGYMMRGRVLRPSKVKVGEYSAKGGSASG